MWRYLTPVDWALWPLEVVLTAYLLWDTRVLAQRLLLTYLLLNHGVKVTLLWASPLEYAQAYYWLRVPENLLLGLAAIGTARQVVPRFRELVTWLGPGIITLSGFLMVLAKGDLTHLEPAQLLVTVAVGGAVFLLTLVLWLKPRDLNGWAYLSFLLCVLLGAQASLKLGYDFWGRTLPELSWVVGLALWAGVLRGTITDRFRSRANLVRR